MFVYVCLFWSPSPNKEQRVSAKLEKLEPENDKLLPTVTLAAVDITLFSYLCLLISGSDFEKDWYAEKLAEFEDFFK